MEIVRSEIASSFHYAVLLGKATQGKQTAPPSLRSYREMQVKHIGVLNPDAIAYLKEHDGRWVHTEDRELQG